MLNYNIIPIDHSEQLFPSLWEAIKLFDLFTHTVVNKYKQVVILLNGMVELSHSLDGEPFNYIGHINIHMSSSKWRARAMFEVHGLSTYFLFEWRSSVSSLGRILLTETFSVESF